MAYVTPTARMSKLATFFTHHEARGKCILCKGENFFCPGYMLCGYGNYLVAAYDKILDRLWKDSYLDAEPESLPELRPGRTRYWVGKLFGEWDADWEWYRVKWSTRCRRLLARIETTAERYYFRNLSNQGMATQASTLDDPNDSSIGRTRGVRLQAWMQMGRAGIIRISRWNALGRSSDS